MGITDKVTSVDPAAGYDVGSWIVFSNVFQSLLRFGENATTPEPDVAESCGFSKPESVYFECRLRREVRFSDGHELTSKDVRFSFERTLRIRDTNGPAVLLDSIRSIATPSADRVVFRLKYHDATFPMKIASAAGSIVDRHEYPADRLREDGEAVGSGPYAISAYGEGKPISFTPNDRYRGVARMRNSGVTMRFYEDERKLKRDLAGGAVDFAYRGLAQADVAAAQRDYLAGSTALTVVEGTGTEVQHLVFNMKDPVVGNRAVRRAVAYLVDRDKIAADVYHHTTMPLYAAIPQGVIGHGNVFFDRYGRGDEKAKAAAELARAGVDGKVRFTLWATPVRYGTGTVAEAELIARQLNSSGLFDVDVKTAGADEYAEGVQQGKYAAYIRGWVPDYPDPDNFTTPLFGEDSVLANHYSNKRIIRQLLPQSIAETDRSKTVEEFRELQQIVADDVPIVPLWQSKQYIVAGKDIEGLTSSLDTSTVFRLWNIGRTDRSSWW